MQTRIVRIFYSGPPRTARHAIQYIKFPTAYACVAYAKLPPPERLLAGIRHEALRHGRPYPSIGSEASG